jgi:hypothetical protein
MGPPALLPVREEGVLRIFIALKNPSLWQGSKPQPLGPVASRLTATPSRRLVVYEVCLEVYILIVHTKVYYDKIFELISTSLENTKASVLL